MGVVSRRNGSELASTHSDGPKVEVPPRPLLICFSQLRWDFVYQRPQQLLSRAAKTFEVCFIEEPIFENGPAQLRTSPRGATITVAVPVLPHGMSGDQIVAAQRSLIEQHFADEDCSRRVVLWYYTPMAFGFSRDLASDLIIYDNMDELSAFRGAPPELLNLEQDLFTKADLVFTGGQSLYKAKRSRHPRVHAFPSSIDAPHFARARGRDVEDPADQADIPRPRLGYFGVIDERMDIDLVAAVAELRADWHFVMLGPVVKIDPASLPQRPNIHWIGMKPYSDLPAYLSGWDVGWMPFARNESTAFISPTKTPEYLAAGVPVVSTPIVDVVSPYGDAGLVEIAADAEATVRSVEGLLNRPGDAWLRRVDGFLAGNSWDETWAGMQALMDEAPRAPTSRGDKKASSANEGALRV